MASGTQGHSGHKLQGQDLESSLWTPSGAPSHLPMSNCSHWHRGSEGTSRKETGNVGRNVTTLIHQLPEGTLSRQAKLLRVWEAWLESIWQGFLVCFLLPSPWHLRCLCLISFHCLLPGSGQSGHLRNCGFSLSFAVAGGKTHALEEAGGQNTSPPLGSGPLGVRPSPHHVPSLALKQKTSQQLLV